MLSEEQKAIKYFYNLRATIDESYMLFVEEINVKCGKDMIKQITLVLNLITKLQKENEEKDKQIDLIIEEYEYNDRINFKNFCEDELRKDSCIQDCKLCAKHYFEKLVKEKGE